MGGGRSKHEDEARREREENERLRQEIQKLKDQHQKWNDEKLDFELQRTKAEKGEKEVELRRITEKLKQMEENERLRQEIQKLKDQHQKWNDEKLDFELQRTKAEKAEKEAELRRITEKLKQMEENERLKREIQNLEDPQQRLNDEKRDLELKSTKAEKAEKGAELRRINEELEQTKKNQKMKEDLRRIEEEKRRLIDKIKLDNFARKLEESARSRVEQEVWLRQEVEKNLEEGIPPIKYPTGEQIKEKRTSLEYQEGFLHIAITGCSGSGKSSLINAVRGYKNPRKSFSNFTSLSNFADAVVNTFSSTLAPTGTNETTTKVQRYADPHHARKNLAWYDVPGAGILRVRDWQYFNNQGLYIFDIIMIAVGDRITKTDLDLLFHCKRFGIPTFFVRSKADRHIANMARDEEASEDEVRPEYIVITRAMFSSILTDVGLPPQKIYIVSKENLRLLNDGKRPEPHSIIDEEELIRDITDALHKWSTPVPTDEEGAGGV